MGFLGMKKWTESDTAADLVGNASEALLQPLAEEIKKVDEWSHDTSPAENVALVLEALVLPIVDDFIISLARPELLEDILNKTIKKLDWELEQVEKKQSDDEFVPDIRRMKKTCEKILKKVHKTWGVTT